MRTACVLLLGLTTACTVVPPDPKQPDCLVVLQGVGCLVDAPAIQRWGLSSDAGVPSVDAAVPTPVADASIDAGAPDLGVDAGQPDLGVVDGREVIQLAPGLVTDGPLSLAWTTSDVIVRGDPDRPAVFRTSGPCLLRDRGVELHHVTFENISCVATRRGSADDQPCVKWVGEQATSNITFRNFSCTGFATGIIVHPKSGRIDGITLDHVTMTDIYDPDLSRYSAGFFTQAADNVRILDSTFTRAGIGTCYSHAVYVQGDSGPVEVARSTFSGGGDVELRSGGTVVDSSFSDAPDLLYFGGGSVQTAGGVTGSITRSTFAGAKDFPVASPGCGGQVKGRALRVENTRSLVVSDISISGSASSTSPILLDATINGNLATGIAIQNVEWDSTPKGVSLVETRGSVSWTEK